MHRLIWAFTLTACAGADRSTTPQPAVPSTLQVPAASAPATSRSDPSPEIDARFVGELQKLFAEYKEWGRVDDEMRWSPALCRMPLPGTARMSVAEGGPHAKKLYSLFARDRAAYVSLGTSNPLLAKDGQAVIKESYLPEVVAQEPLPPQGGTDHFHPYATADGKVYRASKMIGLYVVLEKSNNIPGTDEGFIYGTVTPTGEVTSAGRVASCMGCHAHAKHRRYFGAPTTR